jgi:mannose-6-phosphate isomerase-like protein (cupin superfamily)
MIIRGSEIPAPNGRQPYPIVDKQAILHHFSIHTTTPANPFGPHKHEAPEIWYIIEGDATVSVDGQEDAVSAGDLVTLDPWSMHGLRSENRARWICIG